MVEVDTKEKPVSFLNRYISDLKSTENEVQGQKDALRQKVKEYDDACLTEL